MIMETADAEAVVSAVPIWKTQRALDRPSALSVRVPVNCAEFAKK